MNRVLQVFARMDCGGAETMIMELYRNIDRTKIQFDFVVHTTEKCTFDDEILSLGGRIFSVPNFSISNAFKYRRYWKRLLSQHPEWQIIHGHVRSTASLYLSVAKKLGRTTIAHSHNISSGGGIRSKIKDLLQKRIGKYTDYFFACSQAAGKWLFGEKVIYGQNYYILNNAINVNRFIYNESIRKKIRRLFSIHESIVVGNIGSFINEQKNQSFLLEVFKEMLSINPGSILLLVGDGEIRPTIEKKAKELHIFDKVIFTGVRSDVNELLQAMDVFVFPSKFEGLGIAAIEAQVSGLPTVISDCVPSEVVVTKDLVSVLSLKESPRMWADHILSRIGETRRDHSQEVIDSGYDISSTSKWLEEFYLEKSRK